MAYGPHTPAERERMLGVLGIDSVEALFADIPAPVHADRLDLPAPASELETVEDQTGEARDLALRVRAAFDSRRRREAELTALVETARDLAALRDPAGVLEAIVRRARTLLGTDVSYLTLYDREAGDTYMRATDGSVSAEFQRVRLSLGDGVR